MAKIITFHSFRRGTGKSTIMASAVAHLAAHGLRVGVLDTDLQSPSAHILFSLDADLIKLTLNDFLWGKCDFEDAVYDVTPDIAPFSNGRIFLCPASSEISFITQAVRDGFEIERLNEGFSRFVETHALDVLVIDSHAGISEDTLISLAITDVLAVMMRLDKQDYEGTAIMLGIAKELDINRVFLVVNNIHPDIDLEAARHEIQSTYACDVAVMLPYNETLMTLASTDIFTVRYPKHAFTIIVDHLAEQLLGE